MGFADEQRMNNLISREAATATASCRFAVVASRLATRRVTIPTAYAVGYMLSSLRDCEIAQLQNLRFGYDYTSNGFLSLMRIVPC
jgi:hypothetical protein